MVMKAKEEIQTRKIIGGVLGNLSQWKWEQIIATGFSCSLLGLAILFILFGISLCIA